MDKFVDKACKGIEFLIAFGLAIMVVLVFGNVVLRYGFNSGITVSEELSRWLFIWGTFLGALVALREPRGVDERTLRRVDALVQEINQRPFVVRLDGL